MLKGLYYPTCFPKDSTGIKVLIGLQFCQFRFWHVWFVINLFRNLSMMAYTFNTFNSIQLWYKFNYQNWLIFNFILSLVAQYNSKFVFILQGRVLPRQSVLYITLIHCIQLSRSGQPSKEHPDFLFGIIDCTVCFDISHLLLSCYHFYIILSSHENTHLLNRNDVWLAQMYYYPKHRSMPHLSPESLATYQPSRMF